MILLAKLKQATVRAQHWPSLITSGASSQSEPGKRMRVHGYSVGIFEFDRRFRREKKATAAEGSSTSNGRMSH